MRTLLAAAFAIILPIGTAIHETGCVPTAADPATLNTVDLTAVGGPLYYLEERGNPMGTTPPIPFTGFMLPGGEGTWWYEESNGVPGMQRGACGEFPGTEHWCSCYFPPNNLGPCLIIEEDWYWDEDCWHGPDTLRL